jgi:hypothetical protein
MPNDPRDKGPKPPYSSQKQKPPGLESEMDPLPDYGEQSYKGSGKLKGNPRELRGSWSDLDAAHPSHHARGEGENLRPNVALGRAGQPFELAPVFVLLASDDSSYMAGATVAVTGEKPLI